MDLAAVIRELGIGDPKQVFHGKVDHVGVHYEVSGQAGYVGPAGVSKQSTFVQAVPPGAAALDLLTLAEQLAAVRSAMRNTAPQEWTVEQDDQIGHVAGAQLAAQDEDEAGVLAHLKRAGAWALSVAKQTGMEVAAQTLARAISG
jgi:hypothetical protein